MTVAGTASRCGIDTVEIARVERLLRETPEDDIARLFSRAELDECAGAGRAASLAARFAAKEACLKLFPRETALGTIVAEDFSVARDPYGAPRVVCGAAAQTVLGRNRIKDISVSLSHDRTSATAVALAHPMVADAPWLGRVLYRLLPLRRKVVLENLRRVFGDATPAAEIEALAQAHYAHIGRLLWEFLRFPWLSAERRRAMVRVENLDALIAALGQGKGVLILTGHFGNFEVATAAGLDSYPRRAAGSGSCAGLSSRRGWTGWWRDASPAPASASCPSAVDSTRSWTSWPPATWWCSRSTSMPAARTACWWSSSGIPPARFAACPSLRCRPARRSCRLPAGASPTERTCCASRPRSRRSSMRTPTRRSG